MLQSSGCSSANVFSALRSVPSHLKASPCHRSTLVITSLCQGALGEGSMWAILGDCNHGGETSSFRRPRQVPFTSFADISTVAACMVLPFRGRTILTHTRNNFPHHLAQLQSAAVDGAVRPMLIQRHALLIQVLQGLPRLHRNAPGVQVAQAFLHLLAA